MGWRVKGSNPGGGENSVPVLTGPGMYPSSSTMLTGSLLGEKRPGRCAYHTSPSGADVKKE